MKLFSIVLPLIFVFAVAVPPMLFRTSTYPMTVVEGNSMNPTLSNGDLVAFASLPNHDAIPNGTVIAFNSGQTGLPALDYFIRPVVIHRIIGEVVQADGVVYYRTKGDNNRFTDPTLVRADNVLGTPTLTVPMAGGIILFLKSPSGMILLVASISFLYLNKFDDKTLEEKRKKELLAVFAKMVLNGELSVRVFEKFKLVVEFSQELSIDSLTDPLIVALSDWSREGGPKGGWEKGITKCPPCLRPAVLMRGKRTYFLLCPTCDDRRLRNVNLPSDQNPIVGDVVAGRN